MRLLNRLKSVFNPKAVRNRRTNRGVPFSLEELNFVDTEGEIIGCDYNVAATILKKLFDGTIIPKELVELLEDYWKNPCLETALDIILFDAKFLQVFVDSKNRAWLFRESME